MHDDHFIIGTLYHTWLTWIYFSPFPYSPSIPLPLLIYKSFVFIFPSFLAFFSLPLFPPPTSLVPRPNWAFASCCTVSVCILILIYTFSFFHQRNNFAVSGVLLTWLWWERCSWFPTPTSLLPYSVFLWSSFSVDALLGGRSCGGMWKVRDSSEEEERERGGKERVLWALSLARASILLSLFSFNYILEPQPAGAVHLGFMISPHSCPVKTMSK